MNVPRHLILFVRYPQAGRGKRRLAAGIGAIEALRFQRVRLALLTARLARDPRWTTWFAMTPDGSGPWPPQVRLLPQGNGDLGQRMGRIMRRLPRGPAIIIGADIPGITSSMISRAFHALGGKDGVFGPATDGGYWLIGLRRRPRLRLPFDGVRWSTAHALADTMNNMVGQNIALIDTLSDVDTELSYRSSKNWARLCYSPDVGALSTERH